MKAQGFRPLHTGWFEGYQVSSKRKVLVQFGLGLGVSLSTSGGYMSAQAGKVRPAHKLLKATSVQARAKWGVQDITLLG